MKWEVGMRKAEKKEEGEKMGRWEGGKVRSNRHSELNSECGKIRQRAERTGLSDED